MQMLKTVSTGDSILSPPLSIFLPVIAEKQGRLVYQKSHCHVKAA